MANKTLFSSLKSLLAAPTPATRRAAWPTACRPSTPWRSSPRPAASTARFTPMPRSSSTTLKTLVDQVDDNAFLAKLAVYSRERALMKDMPAALLLVLSKRDTRLFRKVFDRVVDNGRTLRTLVQFVRSGQFGRKSLSTSLQRAVQRWLNTASVEQAAVGLDRQRSEPARRAAPGSADADRTTPAGRCSAG